jgi:choline dehydrogenase
VLTGPRPQDPVEIAPNYLSSPIDQQVVGDMARVMRRFADQPSLAEEIVEEMAPTAALHADEEIVTYARENPLPGHHATSTCKMGQDALAVVDPRLRVRGMANLRVMDCSVMPTLISGNTNGPVMAMAWHAANLIIDDNAN